MKSAAINASDFLDELDGVDEAILWCFDDDRRRFAGLPHRQSSSGRAAQRKPRPRFAVSEYDT